MEEATTTEVIVHEQASERFRGATRLPGDFLDLLSLPEKPTFGSTFFVDQLVATQIKNPGYFERVITALKQGQDINGMLLSADNPFVRHIKDRLETEVAQFGNKSQVVQEAITNGAEAKKPSGESVAVDVNIDRNYLKIADNGKGMKFGVEFMQILRPHSGEEDKIRGQFGQGTKAYWRLLSDENSYMLVKSVTETGEAFTCQLGYTKEGRRYCKLLDYSEGVQAPSGTSIEFVNCAIGDPSSIVKEIGARVEDIDYAKIKCNGAEVNQKAVEGKKYEGGNGSKIIVASTPENISSDMQVRVNVRGETLWESDFSDSKAEDSRAKPRLIIDLSKEAMTAEARSLEHIRLTEQDRKALLSAIHSVATDGSLEPKDRAKILAALSRPFTFLQTKNTSTAIGDDLTRYIAEELIPLIKQENLGVVAVAPGIDKLDWGDDVLRVDQEAAKYLPAEARKKAAIAARGFAGETTLYEAPVKGRLEGDIFVEVGGKIFVNTALLEGTTDEWPIRARGLNTALKLRDDIGVDIKPVNGEFRSGPQSAKIVDVAEPEPLWPKGTTKLDLADLASAQKLGDQELTALETLQARVAISTPAEEPQTEAGTKEKEEMQQKLERLFPTLEDINKHIKDIFKLKIIGLLPKRADREIGQWNAREFTDLLLGGEENLDKELSSEKLPGLIQEWKNISSEETITNRVEAWQPILAGLSARGEQGIELAKNLEKALRDGKTLLDHFEYFFQASEYIFNSQEDTVQAARDRVKQLMNVSSAEEWHTRVGWIREEVKNLQSEQKPDFYRANILLGMKFSQADFSLLDTNYIHRFISHPAVKEILLDQRTKLELIWEEERRRDTFVLKFGTKEPTSDYDIKAHMIRDFVEITSLNNVPFIEDLPTLLNLDHSEKLSRIFDWFRIGRGSLDHQYLAWEIYSFSKFLKERNLTLDDLGRAIDILSHLKVENPFGMDYSVFNEAGRYSNFIDSLMELQKLEISDTRFAMLANLLDLLEQRVFENIADGKIVFFDHLSLNNSSESKRHVRFLLSRHLLPYLNLPQELWLKEATRWLGNFTGTEESLNNLSWSDIEGPVANPVLVANRLNITSNHPQGETLLKELTKSFALNTVRYKRILEIAKYLCEKFPEKQWGPKEFHLYYDKLIRNDGRNKVGKEIDSVEEYGIDIPAYIRSDNYSQDEIRLLGLESQVTSDWLEGKDIVSKSTHKLSDQAAIFILAKSQGEQLGWNTLVDSLEHPSEDLTQIDRRWVQRDLSAAINSQGGGPLRFWNEWRQNSQNASLKLPPEQRKALVATGVDQNGRRFAQMVDFVGMKPEEALWSLPTVGFTSGETPTGSLSRFRMGWLTCLSGAAEVRVRTSIGDGKVTYLRFIPIRNEQGKVIDADVEAAVVNEQTGRITDMTWFAPPGIASWTQGKELDQTLKSSAKYLKPEELEIFQLDKPLSGDRLPEERSLLNKPITVADRLKDWELRLLGSDEAPLLLQGGFKIGERMPDGLERAIPSVIRRTLVGNGLTLALSIDRSIALNKSRDRIEKEDELVENNSDLVTAMAVRGLAQMIIKGQISTAKEDAVRGKSPLAYDFNKDFLDRSILPCDRRILNSLELLADGEVPNLNFLRSDSDESDRQTITMAVNLPLIKSGVDGIDECFSIVDLLTIRAGASFLLEGSLPDNLSVYEMIKPLVKESENGELLLSDQALKLLLDNSKILNQAKMRALWAVQSLKPLENRISSFIQRLTNALARLKSTTKVDASKTWQSAMTTNLAAINSREAPSSATELGRLTTGAKAILAGVSTAAGGGSLTETEDGRLGIHLHRKRGGQKESPDENTPIELSEHDRLKLSSSGLKAMATLREAVQIGQTQEQEAVSPDKFLNRRRWPDAGVYPAIAAWATMVLKVAYGRDVNLDEDIGFYIDPTGQSSAHGAGKRIAFNLLEERYARLMEQALRGDTSALLASSLAGTTIHEGEHLEESGKSEVWTGKDTHDLVFKQRLFATFSRFLRIMLAHSESGTLRIREEHEKLISQFSPTSIQGKEFYARL